MAISDNKATLWLPSLLKFGSAVSSFQVEGDTGERASDWDVFLQHHPVTKSYEIGPQWWQEGKAEKDIDTLSSLHLQMQRLSIEWARIEPEKGKINSKAIERYREILEHLRKKNMLPQITLNHYTLPQWVAQQGSWENHHTVTAFARYVAIICNEFSHVTQWVTLNEPNVLIDTGYLSHYFPPRRNNLLSAIEARKNMLAAHREAYKVIKRIVPLANVGMTLGFRYYRPENPHDIFEQFYADTLNFLDSFSYISAVEDTLDYIGCNYYTGYFLNLDIRKIKITMRTDAAGIPKTLLFGETKKSGAYISDMGWPIVPSFFIRLLRKLHHKYHKPIIITENGIADKEDKHRALYILTHLVAVWKAIQEGIKIDSYIYWSSVDNLEWLEGYSKHFGLIHIDPVSGERTIQKSAYLYRDIIRSRKIEVESLMEKYIPPSQHEKTKELVYHVLERV